VLGLKAASLDRALARLATERLNTIHVPLPATLSHARYMAHDGYHPSAAGCCYWADKLVAAVPTSALV
jgi:hypothetical protein